MDTDSTARVRVEMTVTEEVTYEFPLTVDVPAEVADDVEALTEHLAGDDSLWIDDLPVTGGEDVSLSVNERVLERVQLPSRSEAA
ncbi:hypothetical protein IAG44_39980 [Streptomyces roseirectus]|uniref:Uncharacterized protein n=1 Tax=Streptomyces roseirectus TaxID=2768066 RepID=A0A7H0IQC6_9ACTN|nr:hypothetical protein [Streptomyces roseirectus]QNP74992.1 hypothetical protein IAG44_39980 [Streptomyces roseirectus]